VWLQRDWLEEDMKQFHAKLDADKNGMLDKEEFTKWMTTQFGLPGSPLARQLDL